MLARPSEPSVLCYLDAAHIEGPLAAFEGAEILDSHDQKLGTLEGILLDASRRQVQYLVVKAGRLLQTKRYLLPLAQTRIDSNRQALRVGVDQRGLTSCDRFDPAAFRPFSDDDLLTAVFARDRAASPAMCGIAGPDLNANR